MGKDLYDSFDSVKTLFKQADEAVGFPLSKYSLKGRKKNCAKRATPNRHWWR